MAYEWNQAKVSHGGFRHEQLIRVHYIHLQLELIVSSLKWLLMCIDRGCLALIELRQSFDLFK